MKEKILRLIDNNISGAQDNAYRARRQFDRMAPEQLDKEYGESGRKCKDILADYEADVKAANDMKTWFMLNTPNVEVQPRAEAGEARCSESAGTES